MAQDGPIRAEGIDRAAIERVADELLARKTLPEQMIVEEKLTARLSEESSADPVDDVGC